MGLLDDARNIQRKDPAARTVLEVILLYPGFHILVYPPHRPLAVPAGPLFPGPVGQPAGAATRPASRSTPAPTIGSAAVHRPRHGHRLWRDHRDRRQLAPSTTASPWAAPGKDTGKRHPTLGNNVLIGAGTKVLGPGLHRGQRPRGRGQRGAEKPACQLHRGGRARRSGADQQQGRQPGRRPRPAGPARYRGPAAHRPGSAGSASWKRPPRGTRPPPTSRWRPAPIPCCSRTAAPEP